MAETKKKLISLENLETFAGELKSKYALKTDVSELRGETSDTSDKITVYGARKLAEEKVASVGATAKKGIEVGGTATAPTVGVKLSSKAGNELAFADGESEDGGLYFKSAAAPVIAVQEKATANTGYLKSYQVTVDGTPVSVDIDIPKDFLVKSGSVKTATKADDPYDGAKAGDKYIDFVINVKSGSADDEHIYLPVNELVDAYLAGNGLELGANNTFSIKIDAANANGLEATAAGLKLGVADDTHAGAMSAADHTKLTGIFAGATKVEVDANGVGTGKINDNAVTFYSIDSDVEAVTEAQIKALLA